ncbi:MAG TPA: SDR family NAD(P)-dependent oxidoreductase, partial [Thermoanaerobaculia bacterium]|nr:SDR family NAD(P)-dependent oxidoreductase [Thermoanaerobaculia bacterium]
MKRFEGRRAFVTGASRGIGEAVASRLAEEGAAVIAAARTAADLERVVGEITAAGGTATALPLDLSNAESIEAAAKAALSGGPVDVLVNNAGVTDDNLLLRMSREAWERVIGVNLTGAFLLTQALVK